MELRFAPLFSGSSGNAVYVGCDAGHVLVDAGVSATRILAEMKRVGIDPGSLQALAFMLLYPFIIYRRIRNEEEVLRRDLPGYTEYCVRVRYRLIPFVW